jgi:hypothetical protein
MKKWFTLCALIFCVGGASAQDAESPNVPLSDSAYADIKIFEKAGIVEQCFGPPLSESGMTRYEFAVAVARLAANLTSNFQERQSYITTPLQAAALERLVQKFRPELKEFGVPEFTIEQRMVLSNEVNPPRLQAQFFVRATSSAKPQKIAPPFFDVPKNHWAFAAVEKLRQSGVLLGYTDGSFSNKE